MLRVSLAVMFIAHGLLTILVYTLPGTAQQSPLQRPRGAGDGYSEIRQGCGGTRA